MNYEEYNAVKYILFYAKLIIKKINMWGSTAVELMVACAQRARVRSPVETSFLGEVFTGFFLTCKTNVRKL